MSFANAPATRYIDDTIYESDFCHQETNFDQWNPVEDEEKEIADLFFQVEQTAIRLRENELSTEKRTDYPEMSQFEQKNNEI